MTIIQGLIASMGGSAPPPPPPPDVIDAQYYSDNNMWYALGAAIGSGPRNNTPSVLYTYPGGSSGYVVQFTGIGGSSEYMFSPNLKVGNQTWASNAITIDIWFYPTANGIQVMSETDAVDPTNLGYHYSILEIDSGGYVHARFWDGSGGHAYTSEATVTLNAWNHIYFYEDTQGGHELQVNGVRNQSTQAPTYTRQKPSNGEYFSIGWGDTSNMVTITPFQGKIGDINIHDYVVNSTYTATKSKYLVPPP